MRYGNPLTPYLETIRALLLEGQVPGWTLIAYCIVVGPVFALAALARGLAVGVTLLIEFTAPIYVVLWARFGQKQAVRSSVWLGLALAVQQAQELIALDGHRHRRYSGHRPVALRWAMAARIWSGVGVPVAFVSAREASMRWAMTSARRSAWGIITRRAR